MWDHEYTTSGRAVRALGVLITLSTAAVSLGQRYVLTELGPLPGYRHSYALGVNDFGEAVGYLYDNSVWDMRAFIYHGNGFEPIVTDVVTFSQARGINNAGQIVGEANVDWSTTHAVLWQGGEMIDLNTRISPGSGWELASAAAISENGYIVGYAFVEGEFGAHGFLLTPVAPLPGDMNCDGVVDFADINPFVQALTEPATYADTYPACENGDLDDSGDTDFGDINPFVALLLAA